LGWPWEPTIVMHPDQARLISAFVKRTSTVPNRDTSTIPFVFVENVVPGSDSSDSLDGVMLLRIEVGISSSARELREHCLTLVGWLVQDRIETSTPSTSTSLSGAPGYQPGLRHRDKPGASVFLAFRQLRIAAVLRSGDRCHLPLPFRATLLRAPFRAQATASRTTRVKERTRHPRISWMRGAVAPPRSSFVSSCHAYGVSRLGDRNPITANAETSRGRRSREGHPPCFVRGRGPPSCCRPGSLRPPGRDPVCMAPHPAGLRSERSYEPRNDGPTRRNSNL